MQVVKSLVKSYLSEEYLDKIRYIKMYFSSLRYKGLNFKCPICRGHFRVFLSAGLDYRRRNAACPRCGSLERHRLIWMYLQDRTNMFTAKLKVLHFAPEFCFQRIFRSLSNLDYVSADLYSSSAIVKMDITNIKYDENTFDCILCCHVLEHVYDDRQAMRELYRVLKPNGWGIIQVPVSREKTFEDPTIKTPEQRLEYYGQEDHVRIYGLDYKEKLQNAGFKVKDDPYLIELSENIVNRYRLVPENQQKEKIYFCSKPEAN